MKYVHIILLCFLLSNHASVAGGISPATNEYVKAEVSLKEKSLKAGAESELIIWLRPKKGFHINLRPPIEIKLDSSSAFTLAGKPDIPKSAKNEYLDTSRPIKQTFVLSRDLKPGSVQLKGMLTYFYCSGSGGWCSKFKQPIDLTFTVAP